MLTPYLVTTEELFGPATLPFEAVSQAMESSCGQQVSFLSRAGVACHG